MLLQVLNVLLVALVLGLFTAPPVVALLGIPVTKNPARYQAWAATRPARLGRRLLVWAYAGNATVIFVTLLSLRAR